MLLVAVTVGLEMHVLTGLDTAVANVFPRHRDPVIPWPARAGFALGQTWVFPVASALLALLLAKRHRSVRPVMAVAAVWLVHSAVTGALKLWASRQAPGSGQPALHSITGEWTDRMSYPSGHLANILVFTAVIGVLLTALTGERRWHARLLIVGIAGSAICAASMIYLGYHWTTDALAGLALGCIIRIAVTAWLPAALDTRYDVRKSSLGRIARDPAAGRH
jgi:membrane-associated phospholipid phosphatase